MGMWVVNYSNVMLLFFQVVLPIIVRNTESRTDYQPERHSIYTTSNSPLEVLQSVFNV